jgi:hypothetical protein
MHWLPSPRFKIAKQFKRRVVDSHTTEYTDIQQRPRCGKLFEINKDKHKKNENKNDKNNK